MRNQKILFRLCLLTSLAFSLLAGSALADTWYVKSKTKFTSEPSARSKTLGVLSSGAAVDVVGKEGKFYKVSVGGKTGFVYKFKLTKKAPKGKSGGGGGLGALVGNQKMAAAESSSSSSIRGLSPISEEYAKGHGISQENIAAIKHMESFSVSDQEIDRFQEEGGLGPYGN